MFKPLLLPLVAVVLSGSLAAAPRNGEIREQPNTQVWNAEAQQWQTPLAFWRAYAEQNGGLTWGERTDYPPYDELREHDLMIIQLEQGPCLMEFFHTRWRRANDVRRWDERFSDVGGCANVFD